MKTKIKKNSRRCGLCGSSRKKLIRTDCCNNLICDDENKYVLFSYARNSCLRNHRRFTLCASHKSEGHKGDWKKCKKCRENFDAEMYAWYGTNEYNFEKLENPPSFKPTHCGKCGNAVSLSEDGYSILCDEYRCENCPITDKERESIIKRYKNKKKRKVIYGNGIKTTNS